MRRGEVWWAAMPSPVASEPGFRRPVVLVQSDAFTRSQIRTIIGVVITSNARLAHAPGNVVLSAPASGLPRDSVANVSQIITIDKSFLVQRCKRLPDATMRQIDLGIHLALGL